MSLNILLVDDHAIVRQGIRHLLIDRGIAREVTEAETGSDAMAAVDRQTFDVILLDISLPDTNGIEVLKRIKRKLPNAPVLMFSMYREDQYAVRALKAGAAGYLSKTVNAAQMIGAIQQVAAGRKYVSPAMAEALAEYVSFENEPLPHEKLSDREYQTLCMLASGKRLTDIANTLSLSVKTVSVYRSRLLEKMRLSNNAELTFYVMSNRLVDMAPASAAERLSDCRLAGASSGASLRSAGSHARRTFHPLHPFGAGSTRAAAFPTPATRRPRSAQALVLSDDFAARRCAATGLLRQIG